MASHVVAAGDIAVHDVTLVAGVVESVTFTDDPQQVEVVTDGAAKTYVTTDGSTPTIGGGKTYVIPAVPCARTIRHWKKVAAVQLLSNGAPTVSVTLV